MVLLGKKALLLDMNSTFMFGEDRFGDSEDFSTHYYKIGGKLSQMEINAIVRAAYEYLDIRYPDKSYRHSFPSLESAIREVCGNPLHEDEINKIVDTFAFHELGVIPKPFELVLSQLGIASSEAIVIGDSPRRDLGGAKSAGIGCILVGRAEHPDALMSFGNLLELCDTI
jgi:hypothetical protein